MSVRSIDSRLLAAAALAVVVAAALAVRLATDSSHAAALESGKPIDVSADHLRALSRKRTIYWAGPSGGLRLELTETKKGVYVRYLPRGVRIGDRRALFTTVATYPVRRPIDEARRAEGRRGIVTRHAFGGALVLWSRFRPTNVYVAKAGSASLVEVFDPSPARARALALSGAVRLVGR